MLVLSRKCGERIRIGEDIVITVLRIEQGCARIGIEAPTHIPVYRQELLERAHFYHRNDGATPAIEEMSSL